MHNTMGIIIAGGKKDQLKELVAKRSVAAIPVGAKYRAIDFVLSNMVNSGITKIGMLAQYSFHSLMDHVGSGKEWDLDRRNGGLFLFPPYLAGENSGWYRGSADAMHSNITFLRRSLEKYVLITTGNCVYQMMYDGLLEQHISSGADITVVYRKMDDLDPEELKGIGILEMDEEGRLTDLQEKPLYPKTPLGSMGIYILERELLISLLQEGYAHGDYDFVKDILIKRIPTMKIMGYEFSGYWKAMNSISLYYSCNMDMLNPTVRDALNKDGRIFTKVKDETPAKYNDDAEVTNSIVADGCIIEGTVINSVLFRGVIVKKGAVVKDSIVMQGSVIQENVTLEYTILDKEVDISMGRSLKGDPNYPMIVSKRTVI